MSYRDPGDFCRLPVKSVWGPLAGANSIPLKLIPCLGPLEGVRQMMRNIFNYYYLNLSLWVRFGFKNSDRVIAASEYNQN